MGYVCPEDNNKGVLFGGRFQIFAKRFNDVFTKLRVCGAELIFINDGPSGKFKTVQWCDTNDTTYEITSRIFDSIYDGTCVQEILGEFEYIPRLKGITEALEPKKFGKLYKPLSGLSRNNTIATYASKHKALAVLSDDSDFLIHSGQWKFWSLNRMNSRELTTNEYNKQLLRQKLDLSDREMCMLATIAGNDYVKYRDVMVRQVLN